MVIDSYVDEILMYLYMLIKHNFGLLYLPEKCLNSYKKKFLKTQYNTNKFDTYKNIFSLFFLISFKQNFLKINPRNHVKFNSTAKSC